MDLSTSNLFFPVLSLIGILLAYIFTRFDSRINSIEESQNVISKMSTDIEWIKKQLEKYD